MFRQLFEVIGWIKLHSGGSRKTIKEHLSLQKYFATRLHSNFLESFNLTQTCSGPTITTAVQRDALSGAYLCSHTRNSISGSRIKFERFHLPSSINGCLWVQKVILVHWQEVVRPSTCIKHSRLHSDRNKRSNTLFGVLFGGFLGFLGFHDDEDDKGKVPPSVKRELLKAQRALRNDDYSTAEDCYHQALFLLNSSDLSETQAYIEARAVTLDKLANMYLEQGMYHEAEANFKETLRLMLTAGMEQEHEAVIEISLKLSKVYTNQKRYTEAGVGFTWCVDTARRRWEENKTDEGYALLGMSLQGQAMYFTVVGELDSAVLAYREALRISAVVYGSQSLQYATLLSDLAAAFVDKRDVAAYNEAETLLKESLLILESLRDVTQHIPVIYFNLAMVLAVKDLTDPKIEELIKKSISHLESLKLKDESTSDELALYYFKLGTILAQQGEAVKATAAYDMARKFATKTGNSTILKDIEEARK